MQSSTLNIFKNESVDFSFKFNIYFFLILINFLTYSIYAVLSKYNILFIEIFINLNFLAFFYLYKKSINSYILINLVLKRKEILFFLFLLIFLILISFSELKLPLFIDELAYTRRAIRTAYFSSFLISSIFDYEILKSVPLKFIIQIVSIIQIIFIICIFYLIKNKSNLVTLFVILFINFIFRLILKDGIHHPPLNHFFSSAFISFFGLSHISIRMAYLIPFWFFLISIYTLAKETLGNKITASFLLSLSTFPLLIISSVSPDHSIWSCLLFTYLLIYLSTKKNIDYRFCVLLISVGILFRISIFSSFLLIGLCLINDLINKKFLIKQKLKFLIFEQKIPLITFVFLPLLIISLLGTPAYEGVENVNAIQYFYQAIKSKVIINSLIKQIPFWYYIFIIIVLISPYKIPILIFFIFNLLIYFSVDPDLWGQSKYVLEYGVPFIVLGHFLLNKYLISKKLIMIIYLINLSIFFSNIYEIANFPKSNISSDLIYEKGLFSFNKDRDKKTKYILKIPYKYDEAFDYVSKKDAKKNTLFLGTTYGFLPYIIEDYNYLEIIETIKLRNDFDSILSSEYSLSNKIKVIDDKLNFRDKIKNYLNMMRKKSILKREKSFKNLKDRKDNESEIFTKVSDIKNLKYIILANYGNRENIIKTLTSNNWIIEKKFIETNYRSTLLLFKKLSN